VLETSNDPAEQQLQVLRVASGLKGLLDSNESKSIQLIIVERQCFALEHQADMSATQLQDLLWMIPVSTSVLKVPAGCGLDPFEFALKVDSSAEKTTWIERSQLLSGHGLATIPLPKCRSSSVLATATSWRRAVDCWIQEQTWG